MGPPPSYTPVRKSAIYESQEPRSPGETPASDSRLKDPSVPTRAPDILTLHQPSSIRYSDCGFTVLSPLRLSAGGSEVEPLPRLPQLTPSTMITHDCQSARAPSQWQPAPGPARPQPGRLCPRSS
eukprot:915279-Rhodomonas_salina.1